MPPTAPSPFDPSISPLDHEQAMSYLPWLPQEDLEPSLRRRLLAHLDRCAECRQELLFISELRGALDVTAMDDTAASATSPLDVESSLASVMRRIDHAQPPATTAEAVGAPRLDRGLSTARPQRMTLALAAGLVLAVMVGFMLRPLLLKPVPGTYQTLSDGTEEPGGTKPPVHSTQVTIAFQPETSIQRMQAILRSVDGQIVGGPSALGVWSVALGTLGTLETLETPSDTPETGHGDGLERALTTLRANPETTFAEPKSMPAP